MGVMSIRELNANVSRALSQAEAGEDIVLTRNGKPVLRLTREGVPDVEDRRKAAVAKLFALMERGIDFGGPATYEERTGR
jgi:prevent-host-death family protein